MTSKTNARLSKNELTATRSILFVAAQYLTRKSVSSCARAASPPGATVESTLFTSGDNSLSTPKDRRATDARRESGKGISSVLNKKGVYESANLGTFRKTLEASGTAYKEQGNSVSSAEAAIGDDLPARRLRAFLPKDVLCLSKSAPCYCCGYGCFAVDRLLQRLSVESFTLRGRGAEAGAKGLSTDKITGKK